MSYNSNIFLTVWYFIYILLTGEEIVVNYGSDMRNILTNRIQLKKTAAAAQPGDLAIKGRSHLRVRACAYARGGLADGGARRCAQARMRSAGVSTKLNLHFPGVN